MDAEIDGRMTGNKWEQLKKAASLAAVDRKRIADGDFSVFLRPLAFAMAKDFIFDIIPIVGLIFGFFITVYLFIFMWGRGKWKLRIIFFIIGFLDLLPFIKLIPFDTASVLYGYHLAKKDADASTGRLKKTREAYPEISVS